MEFREHFVGMTKHPTWVMWSWQLELMGFSRQQIVDLCRIKALYQQGDYHAATAEYKRLKFVRWLYRHGRLQS